MTQQDRSEEDIDIELENEITRVKSGERSHSGMAPRGTAESGIAPRADGSVRSGPRSLYHRLLESGALDEVMDEAAREPSVADETPDQAEPLDEKVEPLDEAELIEEPPLEARDDPTGRIVRAKSRTETSDRETPTPLPRNTPTPDEPSVLLGPGACSRGDSTERVVLPKVTEHAVRESLIQPAARPSARPESRRGAGAALLSVALVFAALGSVAWWALDRAAPQRENPPPEATIAESSPPIQLSPVEVRPAHPENEAAVEESAPPVEVRAARPSSQERSKAVRPERQPEAEGVAAEAPYPGGAPETPSRETVVEVMRGLIPTLGKCADGQHGVARLKLTVLGEGRISHALVRGDFAGTEAGSCIARAVKEARFPKFAQRSLKLSYPVQL